jgi:hypothetical protein
MFNISKQGVPMKLLTLTALTALILAASTFDVDAATPANDPTPNTIESEAAAPANDLRQHSFSLELLGRGLLYSFNYDYAMNEDVALGIGAANYSFSSGTENASAWIIPLYANYYFTQGKHRLFATGGANVIFASAQANDDEKVSGSGLAGVLGGGYEYRADNDFLFRAAPYAFVGKASGVWVGFSLGYSI